MKTSENIGKIAMALLKAQKVMGGATKGSNNPFFKSKYADLGAVMQACKDALNDNDIAVLQPVGMTEQGQTYVETILLHSSGEYISDRMLVTIVPTPVKKDSPETVITPQAQGSAITYARRYGLQSMLFIPAEDDDANSAQGHSSAGHQETRTSDEAVATDQQLASIRKLSDSLGKPMPEVKSFMQAARTIQRLAAECKAKAS